MRKFILAALIVLMGATVTAQGTVCESNCQVNVGAPFVAFTEHDATNVGYVLVVDGVNFNGGATIVNGLVEFNHPGFPDTGSHTLLIRAQTGGGFLVNYTDTTTISVVRRKIKIRR